MMGMMGMMASRKPNGYFTFPILVSKPKLILEIFLIFWVEENNEILKSIFKLNFKLVKLLDRNTLISIIFNEVLICPLIFALRKTMI